jgi:diguanylate cyclase (GGDEF)-like protein/PAS domain S-box-containing protein
MSAPKQPHLCAPDEEIPGLIEVLHRTESRLEELTAGEVDSVTSRDGRVLLLRRSQDRLRQSEASRQNAILNALPVNVALLNWQGRIVSVNEAWRRYARENGLQTPDAGVGTNYVEICDRARGSDGSEARDVARGIRSVLSGEARHFSREYPCHTSAKQSWWRLMVAPLIGDRPNGVVVLHLDVSAEFQIARDLRASELRFRQMAESIRDVFFLNEISSGRTLYVSPAYEQIWGLRCVDLYANPEAWIEAIHPADRVAIREQHEREKSTGNLRYQYRIVRPDGAIRWIEARGYPVRDDTGVIVRIAGIAADITERRRAEQELRELDRRISDMLGKMQLLSVMLDDQARITYCNDYFLRLTGWQRDEVIGRDWFEMFQPLQMSELRPVFQGFLANPPESWHRENVIVTRSGGSRTIRWNISVLRSGAEDVVGTASIGEDITEHIEQRERLSYLAYYDSLTGLMNRSRLHELLERGHAEVSHAAPISAVALLDIERFKAINDGFGRSAGDALLKELAARLSTHAGDVDRVARIDADHFAVVISSQRTEEGVAERMSQLSVDVFGRPFQIGAAQLRVSAKCGIAMFAGDGKDGDVPIREAEAALKNAKLSGERWVFYTGTMNERVAERVSFESELRRAVDQGEFVLHYQPKVSVTSGAVTGAEALIRWNRPQTGLVPPGKFIPILETIGLIHEVGRWALCQAIEDHRRWRTMGLSAPRIAVNVSPLQLRSQTFTREVATTIGTDPDAAGGLELEITESLIMENVKHSVASLLVLRAMGLSIAIDDFGTGYSSLSYLSRLPVDTLKIDRSFVADMTVTETGHALVSTIINLARSLKLKIVAEGVETDGQAQMLRLLGCDEMQGFLISKPLTRESFESTFLRPAEVSQASMNPRSRAI